ncbi:ankyrin repeat-containing domain protein [Mycena metata]|uniref:Ankyrin repeat-containing domain protein n=1 Tax=Mycena metata TaxID=1033252 RepID=A0AAD7H095_9AGAR|nr:ankyrin repeat-containing domain protein [Mycena metata]
MVQFLLKEGFDDKPGGRFHTALEAAAAAGHIPVVKSLLKIDTYIVSVNDMGGDYGTALCAACACGKIEVVKALLAAGAGRNLDDAQLEAGKHFGGPLHVAVLMGNREMVELLIGHNPGDADCTWDGVGTAVNVAVYTQNRPLFDLLWQNGLREVSATVSLLHTHS